MRKHERELRKENPGASIETTNGNHLRLRLPHRQAPSRHQYPVQLAGEVCLRRRRKIVLRFKDLSSRVGAGTDKRGQRSLPLCGSSQAAPSDRAVPLGVSPRRHLEHCSRRQVLWSANPKDRPQITPGNSDLDFCYLLLASLVLAVLGCGNCQFCWQKPATMPMHQDTGDPAKLAWQAAYWLSVSQKVR